MSFPSSFSLDTPPAAGTGPEPAADAGRAAIVGHVERWLAGPRSPGADRAALMVVDVDLDDPLPVGEAEEQTRRLRLGRRVACALDAHVRPGDAIARIDSEAPKR